ncbi:MAG TPA: redoxin domain-containing protein [Chloroflexota bacterium]|nr:redoxin domain-containing protein [Chloroflexota bacterium]
MADRQIHQTVISATAAEAGPREAGVKPRARGFTRRALAHPGRPALAFAILVLAVGLILFLSLRPAQPPGSQGYLPTGLAIGQPAPDFTQRDLRNQPIHLRALRGHVILLNFWATYCPPCRLEMPDLERAARYFHSSVEGHVSKSPIILGIDAGAEDRATVARYAQQVSVTYPLLLDPVFEVSLVTYHVANIPFTLILDTGGVIRQAHLGPLSYPEILRAIDLAR